MTERRGFTLIELLVVMVIIGVLAAMLMPVLSTARGYANSSKCQENLRQIGIGLTLCTNENNNLLPNSAYGNGGAATNNGAIYKWMDAIFPYAPTEKIFVCPSDVGGKYTYAKNLVGGQTSTNYGSYGLNGSYGAAGDAQTPPRSSSVYSVNRMQLASPSTTVWVADTNNRQEANGSFGFTWMNAGTNPSITTDVPRQLNKIVERHRAATNVLFCDGHAEMRKLETLTTLHSVLDPIDGATKNVLWLFTVEAD